MKYCNGEERRCPIAPCIGTRNSGCWCSTQKIKEVNVRWTPGLEFKNLRAEAEFNLVPSRKAQADAIEVIRNEETIQGLE